MKTLLHFKKNACNCLLSIMFCLVPLVLHAQAPQHQMIAGKVIDANTNSPLVSVTVIQKGSSNATTTDSLGRFSLNLPDTGGVLVFRYIGYQEMQLSVRKPGQSPLIISLKENLEQLQGITVSTGYQHVPKERATGSFDFINNQLLNRSDDPDILNRIENVSPGILFNHGDAASTDPILIRGRSTIYANAAPLIVLDNFPYDGNINNINPDDIQSITILKDAAAASIWGARAGNGVIVITTKKGHSLKPQIEFNSNLTFQGRPDLFNIHTISSADYIDLEKYLFSKGYYKYQLSSASHPPITPVVELLSAAANGIISPDVANNEIDSMKNHDARSDVEKYLYQNSLSQNYSLSISGANDHVNYYLSGAWVTDRPTIVGERTDRVSLRSQNSFKPVKNLTINANVSYVLNRSRSGNNPGYNLNSGAGKGLYPYAKLVDQSGQPVSIVRDYRQSYVDTAGEGNLLDWTYNPIQDISQEKNITGISDYLVDLGLDYQIYQHLEAQIKYQYENDQTTQNDYHTSQSYFARNMINQFTQVDPGTGVYSFPVPKGGIMDKSITDFYSQQGRVQLSYHQSWKGDIHQVAAIAGWEIKDMPTTIFRDRLYGYDPGQSPVETNMDYVTFFHLYNNHVLSSPITNGQFINKTDDRFLSWFANASYIFHDRYILSASGRKDAANLFGVNANQRGTPLWSAGASWILSSEPFYHLRWLPFLKLRATYGHNGNISRLASAYVTANLFGANTTPATEAIIVGPPNAGLKWEQVGTTNLGIDFMTKNDLLSGSIEYYRKNATDLMGEAAIDPTLGLSDNGGQSYYYGNVAAMKGKGVDIQLNSNPVNRGLKWNITLLFSYSASKVTHYMAPISSEGYTYLQVGRNYINPVQGKPVFSLYSFKWGGLDPANGNPQGYLDGKISEDYASIFNTTTLNQMVYNGPAEPVYFGALRNDFNWKSLSLSFNISYKMGYYFRRPSINYYTLFSSWTGNSDYAKRWQQPGDEKHTNVPSLVYPANATRDALYQYSSVLVDKADNFRLEDLSISYLLTRSNLTALPFRSVRFYLYAANLGTIWVANKNGIDPYYDNVPKVNKSFSLGMDIRF